jgi:sec-independent protein translocase protein TatC
VVLPMLVMVPFLFIAGVVFAYYVIMPAALNFLLGFNDDDFNIQVRASEYYGFFALTEISVGLLFQIPVGILAITRLGIITPRQLSKNRRYAILVIAVIAMLLPGTDPVTMLLCMLPLYVLFELSILLARAFGTPRSEVTDEPGLGGPEAPAGGVN